MISSTQRRKKPSYTSTSTGSKPTSQSATATSRIPQSSASIAPPSLPDPLSTSHTLHKYTNEANKRLISLCTAFESAMRGCSKEDVRGHSGVSSDITMRRRATSSSEDTSALHDVIINTEYDRLRLQHSPALSAAARRMHERVSELLQRRDSLETEVGRVAEDAGAIMEIKRKREKVGDSKTVVVYGDDVGMRDVGDLSDILSGLELQVKEMASIASESEARANECYRKINSKRNAWGKEQDTVSTLAMHVEDERRTRREQRIALETEVMQLQKRVREAEWLRATITNDDVSFDASRRYCDQLPSFREFDDDASDDEEFH